MLQQKKIRFLLSVIFFLTSGIDAYEYTIEPSIRYPQEPEVTIITSVYKCDAFMKGFLEDIVQQTIFDKCELLMIDADSPGSEEEIIKEYMQQYPNITYIKLDEDPGLYGVWNLGIQLARSEYVTNANTDDRLRHDCYELHLTALSKSSKIDLVYSDFYTTQKPNETMARMSAKKHSSHPDFTPARIAKCLPGMNPMWRKSMHTKHGYFNIDFTSAGDWEMWCRAVEGGSLFKKVHAITGLYYENPKGLSTNTKRKRTIERERKLVRLLYGFIFSHSKRRDKGRVLPTQKERRERKVKKKRRIKKRMR